MPVEIKSLDGRVLKRKGENMRILLVWSNIPVSIYSYTAIYSLEMDEEKFARWSKVHRVYRNTIGCNDEQESIIDEISTEIAKIEPILSDKYDSSKPDEAPILLQDYSALIITGLVFL